MLAAGTAPKPAFRTVKKKVKKEGPVAVQLGLSPALAKELKTNGEVTVSVTMTFTPADGGDVQTSTEDVTITRTRRPVRRSR